MSSLIIACPDCGTRYKTDPNSIGPDGRTVRCAKCGSTWFVPAPDVIDTLIADPDLLAHEENLTATHQPSISEIPPSSSEFASDAETIASSSTDQGKFSPSSPAAKVPLAPDAPPPGVGADVLIRDQADAQKLAKRRRIIRIIWFIPFLLVIIAAVIAYLNRQEIVNRIPQMASVYGFIGIEVRVGGLEIDPPQARTMIVDGSPVIRVESVVRNLTNDERTVPLIELVLHDAEGEGLLQWYVEPNPDRIEGRGRLVFTSEVSDPPEGAVGLRYRFARDNEPSSANG